MLRDEPTANNQMNYLSCAATDVWQAHSRARTIPLFEAATSRACASCFLHLRMTLLHIPISRVSSVLSSSNPLCYGLRLSNLMATNERMHRCSRKEARSQEHQGPRWHRRRWSVLTRCFMHCDSPVPPLFELHSLLYLVPRLTRVLTASAPRLFILAMVFVSSPSFEPPDVPAFYAPPLSLMRVWCSQPRRNRSLRVAFWPALLHLVWLDGH